MEQFIQDKLIEARDTLASFISNPENIQTINKAGKALVECYLNGGKSISCGNGGSMCDAIHFQEELTGQYKSGRKALSSISLSDPGFLTCAANDFGFEMIFSRGVEAYGKEGDVLLAISTSGNSKNIINAVKEAQKRKMKTIGLLGKGGGELKKLVDFPIVIPSDTSERTQEIHIKVIHILIEMIERNLFPENYSN